MVWTLVGTLEAQSHWQEFSTPLTSGLIRVSFSGTFDDYPSPIRGFFRLRYGPDSYSVKWFRLYPKYYEKEVYWLNEAFLSSISGTITLQFRKWRGLTTLPRDEWTLTIEQFNLGGSGGGGVTLAFGDESGALSFGPEFTTFT